MNTTQESLSQAERLARLRLYRSENVGPITFRQLMARFQTGEAALDALPGLAKRGGRRRVLKICPRAEAERELDALDAAGGWMVHRGEAGFPPLLAAVEDAPPLLSGLGHATLLTRPAAALVGARECSLNGRRLAERFAAALAEAGFAVVSGMAKGIDAAAHKGALEGGTIAALAGGVDVIYPRENAGLYHEIKSRGALVSEMPFGLVGQARHFPRRNRIISGLSLGVLVVEARQRSGSLITARLAGEHGREVFALPGSPLDARARGPNDLIRKGAALVESPEEMIAYLRDLPGPGAIEAPSDGFGDAPLLPPGDERLEPARALIAQALNPTPVAIDDLVRDLDLSVSIVLTVLLEMELAGTVQRQPGNRVSTLTPE
jgi:DNA processing protein